jgi:triacylglycerol lipase
MPFSLPLAIRLGKFVQDAYALTGTPTPASTAISDPAYTVLDVVFGDDKWDDVDGYVPFGFIAVSVAAPYVLVVCVRGTENLWDWMADANFFRRDCPAQGAPYGAETEDGFSNLYLSLRTGNTPDATTLKAAVKAHIDALGAANMDDVCVCGHSLGGALATLVSADISGSGIFLSPTVYTFASPAVGEKTFVSWYNGLVPDSYRIYNQPDVVPTLPPGIFGYSHVDEPYMVNSGATTQHTVACYHSLSTYLHLLDPSTPLGASCAILPLPAPAN